MSVQYKKLSHTYAQGTPFEYRALSEIDLELEQGKFYAIIGETGSGKSTLVQHLNALLLPTEGSITIDDYTIESNVKPKNLKQLRAKVGLVFQFPEYQLFEETIIKDVVFGPKNIGQSAEEALESAKQALSLVGLDASYYEKSPFDLSGGQKRRVAIAGILAMNPQVLVLDEPTAGLDPQGAKEMMRLFESLNKMGKTIILVSHDMEHVLSYADEVVVLSNGKLKFKRSVNEFFSDVTLLDELKIQYPKVIYVREALKKQGIILDDDCLTLEALVDAIEREVKK